MKQATKLLALTSLLVAGQAMHAQAPAPTKAIALGKDVPELMQLIEKRKTDPKTPINMQNKQLQGAQLANTNLSIDFTGSNLSNANFSGSKLHFITLVKTDLTGANFIGADLSNAFFDEANLTNTNFTNAIIQDSRTPSFRGTNLTNANFTNANLANINFSEANLTNVNFTGAILTDAKFDRVNLTNTNFSNANLTKAYFFDCTGFSSTILNNKTVFSQSKNLTDEQLVYARSKGALGVPGKDTLRLRDLLWENSKSIMAGIITKPINMPNADLQHASLIADDLKDINLAGANLIGADLDSANLVNTNLSGANLTKADFTDCTGFNSALLDNKTNFQDAIGLTPEQKAYARSKGAQNVPN